MTNKLGMGILILAVFFQFLLQWTVAVASHDRGKAFYEAGSQSRRSIVTVASINAMWSGAAPLAIAVVLIGLWIVGVANLIRIDNAVLWLIVISIVTGMGVTLVVALSAFGSGILSARRSPSRLL